MSENWAAVAADVTAALADAGFPVLLEQPGIASGTEYDPTISGPVLHAVYAVDDMIRYRDRDGVVTGTARVLTVGASVTPQKGWRVRVGAERWHRIAEVMPLSPGGTDLLYDLTLEG